MRKLQHLTILGGIITMVLASCSVEKRVHQPGYHVEWHTAQKNVKPLPQGSTDVAVEQKVEKEITVDLPQQEVAVEVPTTPTPEVKQAPVTASKEVVAAEETDASALENLAVEQEKRAMTTYYPEVVPTDGVELSEKNHKKFIKSTLKKQLSKPSGDEGQWLRWWLIAWGVAILLSILAVAIISPAIWVIAGLAWLAGTVFAIIWLVNVLS